MKTRDKIFIAYACLAIIFTLLLVHPLSNYIEFYKAVEKCEITLGHVELDTTQLDKGIVHLSIIFNMTNPTNFRDLKVTTVTCNLQYFTHGQTKYEKLPGLTKVFEKPIEIPPNGDAKILINFTFEYLSGHPEVRDFFHILCASPKEIDFIFQGQYVLYAYTYPFTISMGPFQYTINKN